MTDYLELAQTFRKIAKGYAETYNDVGAALNFEDAANAIEALQARVKALEAEEEIYRPDSSYVIGWHDGFDRAFSEKLKFPTMLRKMWSGGEVQSWLDEQHKIARAALGGA